jgi:hypothetical protein
MCFQMHFILTFSCKVASAKTACRKPIFGPVALDTWYSKAGRTVKATQAIDVITCRACLKALNEFRLKGLDKLFDVS